MVINTIGRELGSPGVGGEGGCSLNGMLRADFGRVFSKDLKKVKEQALSSKYLRTHTTG